MINEYGTFFFFWNRKWIWKMLKDNITIIVILFVSILNRGDLKKKKIVKNFIVEMIMDGF